MGVSIESISGVYEETRCHEGWSGNACWLCVLQRKPRIWTHVVAPLCLVTVNLPNVDYHRIALKRRQYARTDFCMGVWLVCYTKASSMDGRISRTRVPNTRRNRERESGSVWPACSRYMAPHAAQQGRYTICFPFHPSMSAQPEPLSGCQEITAA